MPDEVYEVARVLAEAVSETGDAIVVTNDAGEKNAASFRNRRTVCSGTQSGGRSVGSMVPIVTLQTHTLR